jgi:dTDP-4-amino-4,6-dideoxygalactose transaminase
MTLNNQIPYGRHNISDQDIAAVVSVLKGDWLTTGPLVDLFEESLQKLTNSNAVAVSSGTAALHCAYAAAGIGPGDEVITPPLTFIATQATAALLGAKIVFADIQIDTGNIDPLEIEAKITSRTKAITMVDFAGHPCDIDEIREIADRHNLLLIEDAAHSIGSTYKSKPIGNLADITTFSFFPTKNMTTGEGGALITNNQELFKKARQFGRQGLIRTESNFKLQVDGPWHQEVHDFGLNYRLPDILCAIGVSQLESLNEFKHERTRVFSQYVKYLSPIDQIKLPVKRDYVDPMWHLFPIRVPSNLRKSLFTHLRSHGYLVQVNYLPAHLHPVFSSEFKKGDFPNSESYYSEEISLPLYVAPEVFTDSYFESIAVCIEDFFRKPNSELVKS